MDECIFCRIVRGELKSNIVRDDEHCLVFHDQTPQAPLHLLAIPKKHISSMSDAEEEDRLLLGHLLFVCKDVADQLGHGSAFRLVVNNGRGAGQALFHLHVHLLAGRSLGWPPG